MRRQVALVAVAGALIGLSVGTGIAQAQRSNAPVPDEVARGMDEFWRRGACMLSSVLEPAQREAASPAHPEGLVMIPARTYGNAERLACWTRVGERLYVGSDCAVYEVDLKTGQVARQWGAAEGLLDSPVEGLVGDGERLWVITRSGLCAIDLASGKAVAGEMPRFGLGVVVPTARAVWAVADTGTYVLARDEARWRLAQPMPIADRVASIVRKGFWYALWQTQAAVLFRQAVVHGDSIWLISLGTLLRLDTKTGAWSVVADNVWHVAPDGNRLWLLSTQGVGVLDTKGGTVAYPSGGEPPKGRPTAIHVSDSAVWVLTAAERSGAQFSGGGLYRWDKQANTWKAYPKLGDHSTQFASFLGEVGGHVCVALEVFDRIVVKSAHPGMMHVKRHVPHVTGVCVARYDAEADAWQPTVIPAPKTKRRHVLGQRGTRGEDVVGPEEVLDLAQAGGATLAVMREFPEQYYGGYLITVARLLSGSKPALADYAADLGLVGEQPEIMLLSGTHGARIILAGGQDRVLGLTAVGQAIWTITERRVARFEAGQWQTALATPRRFFWTATAAAVSPEAVWFGTDRGTVCRFDRASGRFAVLGGIPARRVTAVGVDAQERVRVKSEAERRGRLPADLAALPALPQAAEIVFDGRTWSKGTAGEPWPAARQRLARQWVSGGQPNILIAKGEKADVARSAYVLGVYRPRILCQESADVVWLSTYEGLARVDLSAAKAVEEEAIAAALSDPEASRRLWGVRALANVGTEQWAGKVAALLADKNPTVRREAISALRRLATPAVCDPIVAVLDDKDPTIHRTAIDLSGQLRCKAAVPGLIKHLEQGDSRARMSAAYALARIGDPAAIPALEALKDTSDRRLKRAVEQALRQLKKQ